MSVPALPVLELRAVDRSDAADMWRLVRDTPVLDLNSAYCYLLACEEFGPSSLVARDGSELAGFVLALRPPRRPESLFVWQVAVAASQRGAGLGARMLRELIALPANRDARFLEATVDPSNAASLALFGAFARENGADCARRPHFGPEDFPEPGHEAEEIHRIGPLPERP